MTSDLLTRSCAPDWFDELKSCWSLSRSRWETVSCFCSARH